jgi:hypothetical protein
MSSAGCVVLSRYPRALRRPEPVQTASIFYGGAITDRIGAYAQFTYNAQPFGAPFIDP